MQRIEKLLSEKASESQSWICQEDFDPSSRKNKSPLGNSGIRPDFVSYLEEDKEEILEEFSFFFNFSCNCYFSADMSRFFLIGFLVSN